MPDYTPSKYYASTICEQFQIERAALRRLRQQESVRMNPDPSNEQTDTPCPFKSQTQIWVVLSRNRVSLELAALESPRVGFTKRYPIPKPTRDDFAGQTHFVLAYRRIWVCRASTGRNRCCPRAYSSDRLTFSIAVYTFEPPHSLSARQTFFR